MTAVNVPAPVASQPATSVTDADGGTMGTYANGMAAAATAAYATHRVF